MNRFKEYYHSEITHQFVEDLPEQLVQGALYIIGERKFLWSIAMKCPCGCGDLIQLNILRKADPCWTFFVRKKKITIYPSVWREAGCKSHFIVRQSHIIMIKGYYFIQDKK